MSMRIVIIAPGSRGDVQPYVALGKGLAEAGSAVRMVTSRDFEGLVSSHGPEFWPIEINTQELIQNRRMREALEKGSLLASMSEMADAFKSASRHLAERSLEACKGMDLVLAGIGGQFVGLSVAEKLGLPFLPAYNVPVTPTREFPGALLPGLPSLPGSLGGTLRRLSHRFSRQIVWQAYRPSDRLVRKTVLDLPKAPFLGPFRSAQLRCGPILYGISPSVIPPPSDWPEHIHLTGFWFLDPDEDWIPPPALVEFLSAGPPPVYIGFGSMSSRRPEKTAELVFRALAEAKQRGVVLSGWSGMQRIAGEGSVFMADTAPHSWLFSRVAAVVHHGGAGTTAAGLKAGVPSIIIPFHGDQPFWGRLVADLGVGPSPIPRKKLTAERLARAIREALSDRALCDRAVELGSKIQAEDGIARAVELIRRYAARGWTAARDSSAGTSAR